jgi:hypothetical protein
VVFVESHKFEYPWEIMHKTPNKIKMLTV